MSDDPQAALRWHDAAMLRVEGRGWPDAGWTRLPARAQAALPERLWRMSRLSAGICLRFLSDAPAIYARYEIGDVGAPAARSTRIAQGGLDLFARDGALRWRWVGAAEPWGAPRIFVRVGKPLDPAPEPREFMLYLPLGATPSALEIGVAPGHLLAPATPRPTPRIAYYGTSLVQGDAASRPGATHVATLGRLLDREIVNLGFGGAARLEPAMAELLAEVEAPLYLVDPLPNLDAALVRERAAAFFGILRARRPRAQIVAIGEAAYAHSAWSAALRAEQAAKRQAWDETLAGLRATGFAGLHDLPGDGLSGDDGDGTIDGIHCTDLGFRRMAERIAQFLHDRALG